MKVNLTSGYQNIDEKDLPSITNINDSHQLRLIIQQLIKKSKTVIQALEATVIRLERMEEEKNYWKRNYLRYKEICQKYIDAEGVHKFKHLVDLENQLRKFQVQNSCLIEESKIRDSRRISMEKFQKTTMHNLKDSIVNNKTRQTFDKKGLNRSMNTVSFTGLSPHREHRIFPKVLKISTTLKKKKNQKQ